MAIRSTASGNQPPPPGKVLAAVGTFRNTSAMVQANRTAGVPASGTITVSNVQYGDTVTIAGIVLTADSTQTSGGQNFNVGDSASGSLLVAAPIRPGDTVTIGGTVLTAAGAQVGGAYNFNEGVRATGTITAAAVLPGDTVTVAGVTLTAAGAQTPGGLNFNEGTRASGTYTVNASPAAAILTINGSPLSPAGGPRTPGGDDYDETLGTPTLIAADIAAAINDAANSFDTVVLATSLAAVVTVRSLVPGAVGNAITIVSDDATVSASGATLTGGVGTNSTVATSLAAAINDAGNGLAATLTASPAGAVVTVSVLAPGAAGNATTLVSSNGGRLAVSGATFAGGVGTIASQVASLVAAINAVLNVPLPTTVVAVNASPTVSLTAVDPGTSGNAITLATSAPARVTLSGATLTGGGGSDGSATTSLVAAILDDNNGLSGRVTASAASNVITVLAYLPGVGGNGITLASSDPGTLALSGALLAGGENGVYAARSAGGQNANTGTAPTSRTGPSRGVQFIQEAKILG